MVRGKVRGKDDPGKLSHIRRPRFNIHLRRARNESALKARVALKEMQSSPKKTIHSATCDNYECSYSVLTCQNSYFDQLKYIGQKSSYFRDLEKTSLGSGDYIYSCIRIHVENI